MTLARARRSIPDLLALGSLLLAVVFACHTSYVTLRDHYTVPNGDDWRILDTFFSRPLVNWLFADQVGHRIPVTFFLIFLDYHLWLGKMHLVVIAALVCAWIAAGALYIGFRTGADLRSPLSRTLFAFALFGLFWAGSCHDFVWGANQGSQLATMWFLISLALLAVYQRRRDRSADGSAGALPLGAGLAALLATFSHGMGAASWASLTVLSVVGRFPRKVVVGLLLGAILSVAAYSVGLKHTPGGSFSWYPVILQNAPLPIFKFMVTLLGGTTIWVTDGLVSIPNKRRFSVGLGAGAIELLALVVYTLILLRRRSRPAAGELFSLGLMVFPVAGGFLVAVNRVWSPDSAVDERFVTWTTLFWLGAASAVSTMMSQKGRRGALGIGLIWMLSLSMIPALNAARAAQARTRSLLAMRSVMQLAGVQWDQLAGANFILSPDYVYRVSARLRRDRRSVFADPRADLPGAALDTRFVHAPDTRCSGVIRVFREIPTRGEPGAQVFGGAWDVSENKAPASIVLTDSAGVIRGLGIFSPYAGPGPKEAATGSLWVGFVAGFDRSGPYTAYGVLDDGRTVCRLASWSAPGEGAKQRP